MAFPRHEFRLNGQAWPSAYPPQMKNSPQLPPGLLVITTHTTPFDLPSRGVQANMVSESDTGLVIQGLNPSGFWNTEKFPT